MAIYRIGVHLANFNKPEVYLTMYGTLGISEIIRLQGSYSTFTKGSNGVNYTIDQNIDYIGDIYEIELTCEFTASGSELLIDKITITNPDPVNLNKVGTVKSIFTDLGGWFKKSDGMELTRYCTINSGLTPLRVEEEELPGSYEISSDYGVYYYVPAGETYTFTVESRNNTTLKMVSSSTKKVSTSIEAGIKIDTKGIIDKLFQLSADYKQKQVTSSTDTTGSTSSYSSKTTETTTITLKNDDEKYTRRFAAKYKRLMKKQRVYAGQLVLEVDYDGGREFVGFLEVPEDIAARKKAEEEAARKKAKYAQLIGPFNAFPAKLQADCAAVMGKLLYTDELNSSNPFFAQYDAENEWYHVFSEDVRIPYRISYEDSDEIYASLAGEQAKRIYSCIFTRHLDGHIREKHLRKLLSGSIPEWCLPYLLRLSGEYLVELLQPMYDAFKERPPVYLPQFCKENAGLIQMNYYRMVSYWGYYYKDQWSLKNYVGQKLFDEFFHI